MFTVPKFAGRSLAHLGSLLNHRWLIAVVTLVLVLLIRRPVAAQTAEAAGIVVTGEALRLQLLTTISGKCASTCLK
jgi:hypothetical protein